MLFLVIWLFFLKTGSIITQINKVWSSNQQWLVHWVTYCITKSLSTVGWLALQIKANEFQKTQYCKKAGVKIGSLYNFMPSGIILFPSCFVNYLLPPVWGFWLCMCGCHWNWTGRKNHTTADIFFLSDKYLCTDLCTCTGPWSCRLPEGDVFRSSFFVTVGLDYPS